MLLPEFLTEVPYGEIRVTGHRIGLFHVLDDYKRGYSPERLHEEYPTLQPDLIAKVLAFYRDNRAEVDAYLVRCEADMERAWREGKHVDIEELKMRWEAQGRTWPS